MSEIVKSTGDVLEKAGKTPKKGLIAVVALAALTIAGEAIREIAKCND